MTIENGTPSIFNPKGTRADLGSLTWEEYITTMESSKTKKDKLSPLLEDDKGIEKATEEEIKNIDRSKPVHNLYHHGIRGKIYRGQKDGKERFYIIFDNIPNKGLRIKENVTLEEIEDI